MKEFMLYTVIVIILTIFPSSINTNKQTYLQTNTEDVIEKCEITINKAHVINKIAKEQQQAKVDELYETVEKLKKEKQILEKTLKKIIKTSDSSNVCIFDSI